MCEFLEFLHTFWFEVLNVLVIRSYYCVNFWSFLHTFWFWSTKDSSYRIILLLEFLEFFCIPFDFEVLKILVIGLYILLREFLELFAYLLIWSTNSSCYRIILFREFVLKILWRKFIASLHRLTQDVQCTNLRYTAGDPT